MSEAVLSLRGLRHEVRNPDGSRLTVLDTVDLDIAPGDHLAVVGRSGSGKTTLLSVLGLLTIPTAGTMTAFGHDVATLPDAQRARLRLLRLGFVFQSFSLVPHLSAADNVALPLRHGPLVPARETRRRVARCLSLVGMGAMGRKLPRHLSGGEQQRVAIARAIAREPEVLLADEPTGSLDTDTAHEVLDVLQDLRAQHGCALVLVTHDEQVARGAARVIRLEAGSVLAPERPS